MTPMTDAPQDMIFVHRRSTDLARARAFYAALGFTLDERFCGEDGVMATISPAIHLMLLAPRKFAALARGPVAAMGETDTLVSLSRPSRAAVDAFMAAGLAAGGTEIGAPREGGGFLYGRGLADPDGNGLGVLWMDVDAAPRAWGTAA